ncbi:MAG: Gfo/Idh/MocA family oxidoreductase [Bacteroidales bacterium]|nr:Gfo/Idh/MocA family oxidoreductase [Bacteroidales bacterium]
MSNIQFGIIGCGRIAYRHAEQISKHGRLVAVCDIKEDRAKKMGEKFNAHYYSSIDDLLKNEKSLQVVAICTPNGMHAEHTIKSLNAGINVLCEKPMAIDVNDCGLMIQAAEKTNKRLFIVKQNRFNPPVRKVKTMVEEGKLGKIYSVQLNCFWNRNEDYYKDSDWKGTKKLDGGTLFTQFSHFIDLLYWMFGDIQDIQAYTKNSAHKEIIEFDDNGVVILRFFNGAIGTINYTVNSYKKNMEGSLTIFGEKGTVKIGGQYLNELDYSIVENDDNNEEIPQGNPPNDYGQYVGSMANHDKVYENLLDVLLNDGSIVTNCYEGLKTVEIINRIYLSASRNIF